MLSVSGLVAVGTEGFAIVIRPLMFECFLLHCGPWLGLGSEMVARLSELSPYWVKFSYTCHERLRQLPEGSSWVTMGYHT